MPLLELRNINVRRIGYVASETTKNRGRHLRADCALSHYAPRCARHD